MYNELQLGTAKNFRENKTAQDPDIQTTLFLMQFCKPTRAIFVVDDLLKFVIQTTGAAIDAVVDPDVVR